jgi:hypothetical protein
MNSSSFKEKGFSEFALLKEIPFSSLPFNKASVIVLADSTLTGKPTPDILYIGKSKKPTKRIFGGYLAGFGGKVTRKINSHIVGEGYLDKVSISWMLSNNPKVAQQELLESFKKEHGDYPAWNTKKTPAPKPQPAPKVAKTRPAHKQPTKPSP